MSTPPPARVVHCQEVAVAAVPLLLLASAARADDGGGCGTDGTACSGSASTRRYGAAAISAEVGAALGEAIRLVSGRWTALQMAVENQWGARDSRAKAYQFGESILFWFCHTKESAEYENLQDQEFDIPDQTQFKDGTVYHGYCKNCLCSTMDKE
ncbi:uncharacterized protein [Miscanthus floridulus]|uniref:uncharacterized protein isoform X2 n=1 Tax=Miscanthus floridulus TaxID=154761 RepID=UPI0034584AEA